MEQEGPTPAQPDTCPAQDAPKTSQAGSTCLSTPCSGAICSRAGSLGPRGPQPLAQAWAQMAVCVRPAGHTSSIHGGPRLAGTQAPKVLSPPFPGLAVGRADRKVRGCCPQSTVGFCWEGLRSHPSPQFHILLGSQPHPLMREHNCPRGQAPFSLRDPHVPVSGDHPGHRHMARALASPSGTTRPGGGPGTVMNRPDLTQTSLSPLGQQGVTL